MCKMVSQKGEAGGNVVVHAGVDLRAYPQVSHRCVRAEGRGEEAVQEFAGILRGSKVSVPGSADSRHRRKG